MKLNHRKNLKEIILKQGYYVTQTNVDDVLKKCIVCCRKDKVSGKSCKYIIVNKPGDRIGLDILEISHKDRILIAIDYFSRKIWARVLTTKSSSKVLKFIKDVYEVFPFISMTTDNGREFSNNKITKWAIENKVEHRLSVPYYHQSNGRIERVNRTIRNALRKTRGSVRSELKEIVNSYNNIPHRGIGITPNEAVKPENFEFVKLHQEKYKKEFSRKDKRMVSLNVGDSVLLRNEFKKKKMDDEFKEEGVIQKKEENDVYEVLTKNGATLRRHVTQLRRFERGVLDC